MRTTVSVDDRLLAEALRLTGAADPSAVIRQGLELLVQRESASRLARLGGTDPSAVAAPRFRA